MVDNKRTLTHRPDGRGAVTDRLPIISLVSFACHSFPIPSGRDGVTVIWLATRSVERSCPRRATAAWVFALIRLDGRAGDSDGPEGSKHGLDRRMLAGRAYKHPEDRDESDAREAHDRLGKEDPEGLDAEAHRRIGALRNGLLSPRHSSLSPGLWLHLLAPHGRRGRTPTGCRTGRGDGGVLQRRPAGPRHAVMVGRAADLSGRQRPAAARRDFGGGRARPACNDDGNRVL